MRRAFLSHSSIEKDYVRKVAGHLKRAQVVYDEYSFEAGVDFREAIKQGISESHLFVLFASRHALESIWVNFELNEAEVRNIEGHISNFLVFMIGPDISHTDLPSWLRRALIIPAPGAAQTSRMIQDRLLRDNQRVQDLFIGREDDLKSFSEKVGDAGMSLPQVLAFVGLQGVGRRTFAKYALQQNLSLSLGPILTLETSAGLDDLYLQLLDEDMELLSKDSIAKSLELFRRLNEEEQATEIARQLALYAKYNVVPIIIDHGAILKDNGEYREFFQKIMEQLRLFPEASLVLLQTRFPQVTYSSHMQSLVVPFRLNPLSQPATVRLLQIYLRNSSIPATSKQVEEVASYLDGYPPAVIYAKTYAQEYTMDNLVADKTLLTDFKVRSFTDFLVKKNLDKSEVSVLKVLASSPPLSLAVIATAIGVSEVQVASTLRNLVDASLVVVIDGRYSISLPVRDAVRTTWGKLNNDDYSDIANRLKTHFWDEDRLPDIATLNVLVFSLLRANRDNDLQEFAGVIMPSTLLRAARAAYDNREWARARELSTQVLELDDNLDEARVILFKALVRDNLPSEDVLRDLGERHHKSVHYLAGFRAWKRGNYQYAVRRYQQAIQTGDSSIPVYRELAECQYWLGDYDSAMVSISEVLSRRGRPNPYVLDLAAKIAIQRRDFPSAESHISIQELVDRPENVAHRRAVLYVAQGLWDDALDQANKACSRMPPLPETFLLRARILIEQGKLNDAEEELNNITDRFNGVQKDIQIGLRCKLLLRAENWRGAEAFYNELHRKNTPVSRGLRVQILRQKVSDIKLSPLQRQESQRELDALQQQPIADLFSSPVGFDTELED